MYNENKIILTMDKLVIGKGWHEIEKSGDEYFRWLGPANSASIHLDINRHIEYRLNLVINNSISDEVLESLILKADNINLNTTLSKVRKPAYITTVIPKDTTKPKDQSTIIFFKISKPTAGKEIFDSIDAIQDRFISLKSISVFPLSRPLFTAQKFNDPFPFDGIDYLRKYPSVVDLVKHGIFSSAYEHFKQYKYSEYSHDLHAEFDECAGDLYDILIDRIKSEKIDIENHLKKEVRLLKEVLYRQSDVIRKLKKTQDNILKVNCKNGKN